MATVVKERNTQSAANPAEPDITLEEIIHEDYYYSLEQLSELLGITPQTFQANRKSYFTYTKGNRFHGKVIRTWITNENIDWTPSESAIVQALRIRRAKEAQAGKRLDPKETKPRTLAEKAFRKSIENAQRKEREEAERHAEDMRLYFEVLYRDVTGSAKAKDVATLAELITKLELSASKVEEDTSLIKNAIKNQEWHSQRDARAEKLRVAREDFHAIQKEYDDKLWEKQRVCGIAESENAKSVGAQSELMRLAKIRPEFFEQRDGVPQLRLPKPAKK